MDEFKINGQTVNYEGQQPYLSIGIVGSNPIGYVYDVFSLRPALRYGHLPSERKKALEGLKAEVEVDLALVTDFLRSGVFEGANCVRKLDEKDKPAFERTEKLLKDVIKALIGK